MYKYEMHCHTAETSRCSRISGADLVDFYHSIGYTGIVITDHLYNYYLKDPTQPSWPERVEFFVAGYRAAKQRGEALGMDVFFAWEYSHKRKGNDFLTYGLDMDWLLENPDLDELHINDYYDLVHRDGGYVVHAHPFREARYIDMIRLAPRKVDAVETINACRTPFENCMANLYAENYALPKICGSDNHRGPIPQLTSLDLPFRAGSVEEIVQAALRGESTLHLYQYDTERGLCEIPEDKVFCAAEKL
ncbi:MAG: PHP domain-containing protein [Clostridia bacterium]|nr:PHP domain-containing protein [Clostridia bacterium]